MEAPGPPPSQFDLLLGTEWLETDRGQSRALAPESVGDRQAPVATEGLRGDADARRRLAPLVLGPVDKADHTLDDVGRCARGGDLVAALVTLHVGLEDPVEDVVRG